MSARNKALAMAIRRALLLVADAIKVWCGDEDPSAPPVGTGQRVRDSV